MKDFSKHLLAFFFCHWISTAGVVLSSAAAIVFIGFQFLNFTNHYDALIVYLIVPALFVCGLVLVPIGLYVQARASGGIRAAMDTFAWDRERMLRIALIVLAASLLNVTLMSAASYRGLEYLDSTEFCGEVCHFPMSAHYEAHQLSPHAAVACVECHVGPGPTSFVQSKIAGLSRVANMATGDFELPLRISTSNRAPVVRACGNCHSSGQAQGEQLRLIRHYDEDEASTARTTLLLVHVDTAIHASHVNRDIYYRAADAERKVIPWVSADGVDYASGDADFSELPIQRMDCLDCHNRAAHSFEPAGSAVDRAITEGLIDRSVPFAKRDTLRAVLDPSGTVAESSVITGIVERNVFPEMQITWDSYPNNIGHENESGCFRCHDGQHMAPSGATISQDCFSCHQLLAIGERQPAILDQLGIVP